MHKPNANAKCDAKAKTNAEVESEESKQQLNEKLDKENKENSKRQAYIQKQKQTRIAMKNSGFVRNTILSDPYPNLYQSNPHF